MAIVLVTGGAGFIGSHVCKALSNAGYQPVVYDNLSNGHRDSVRWGPLHVGDLADEACLDLCLKIYRPSSVIHLASYIAAGESVADPEKYYSNNLHGLLSLLKGMRRRAIDRIVFSSSAAVYGAPTCSPIPENSPIQPVNPYGHTKAMCEQILADCSAAYGLRTVSLRYFNAAGADPDGELGEMHEPETHLIPLVLETAAGQRPHIDIFGDSYPTPDGTCIRDYVHVSDLASAHVLSLNLLKRGPMVESYNLGNGRGFSVREVIESAEEVTQRPIETRIRPMRAGDPPILLADSQRARKELGWQPRFGDLTAQLRHAWRWQTNRIPSIEPAPRDAAISMSTD